MRSDLAATRCCQMPTDEFLSIPLPLKEMSPDELLDVATRGSVVRKEKEMNETTTLVADRRQRNYILHRRYSVLRQAFRIITRHDEDDKREWSMNILVSPSSMK